MHTYEDATVLMRQQITDVNKIGIAFALAVCSVQSVHRHTKLNF